MVGRLTHLIGMQSTARSLVVTVSGWGLIILLALLLHCLHTYDSDDGVILAGAWDIWNGKRPYLDFFTFIPPGSFYAIFIGWKLLGLSYFTAQGLAILALLLAAFGLARINALLVGKFNLLPAGLFILSTAGWTIINHNVFCLPFLIWALYFLLKAVDGSSLFPYLFSGLLTGLAMLFLLHKGLVLLGCALVWLAFAQHPCHKRLVLQGGLSLAFLSVLPMAGLLLVLPPGLLINDLVLFPMRHYPAVNWVTPVFLVEWLLILIGLVVLLYRQADSRIILLSGLQLCLLLTTLQRPDPYHVLAVGFPAYLLLTITCARIRNILTWPARIYFTGIGALTAVLAASPAITYARQFNSERQQAEKFSQWLRNIHKFCAASKYFYAGPFLPGLYFETRKINPTPYAFLITRQNTIAQYMEARRQLKTHRPGCVILSYRNVGKFGYQRNNPLDAYLLRHYVPVITYGELRLFVANETRSRNQSDQWHK